MWLWWHAHSFGALSCLGDTCRMHSAGTVSYTHLMCIRDRCRQMSRVMSSAKVDASGGRNLTGSGRDGPPTVSAPSPALRSGFGESRNGRREGAPRSFNSSARGLPRWVRADRRSQHDRLWPASTMKAGRQDRYGGAGAPLHVSLRPAACSPAQRPALMTIHKPALIGATVCTHRRVAEDHHGHQTKVLD